MHIECKTNKKQFYQLTKRKHSTFIAYTVFKNILLLKAISFGAFDKIRQHYLPFFHCNQINLSSNLISNDNSLAIPKKMVTCQYNRLIWINRTTLNHFVSTYFLLICFRSYSALLTKTPVRKQYNKSIGGTELVSRREGKCGLRIEDGQQVGSRIGYNFSRDRLSEKIGYHRRLT